MHTQHTYTHIHTHAHIFDLRCSGPRAQPSPHPERSGKSIDRSIDGGCGWRLRWAATPPHQAGAQLLNLLPCSSTRTHAAVSVQPWTPPPRSSPCVLPQTVDQAGGGQQPHHTKPGLDQGSEPNSTPPSSAERTPTSRSAAKSSSASSMADAVAESHRRRSAVAVYSGPRAKNALRHLATKTDHSRRSARVKAIHKVRSLAV